MARLPLIKQLMGGILNPSEADATSQTIFNEEFCEWLSENIPDDELHEVTVYVQKRDKEFMFSNPIVAQMDPNNKQH